MVTHTRVKNLEVGEILILPISKVVEFQRKAPKDKKDFNSKKTDTGLVGSTEDESDDEETVGIQISNLVCMYIFI